jgi:hypothetical protein
MEYALIALVACFVSWCVGVRMGAAYATRRIVEEL